ncbi:MAG: hypothetical protein AB9879_13150 [Methanothrix sp.]
MPRTISAKPIFTISIDFELAWGFILHQDNYILNVLKSDPDCGWSAVISLLKLLEKYNIKATWGTVGHLLLDDDELLPRDLPQFRENWIDWSFYNNLASNHLYYARDLCKKVLASSINHEIGLHSFMHIPFDRCSPIVAEAEIRLGLDIMKRYSIIPKSFIFPENLISQVGLLKDHGFSIYRGDNNYVFDNIYDSLRGRIVNNFDKLIGYPVLPQQRGGIWEIKPSTFAAIKIPYLNKPMSLLYRGKIGVNRAIESKKIYHIWLHPWNLLLYDWLEEDLDIFFKFIASKRTENQLEIRTMSELVL